MPFQVYELGRGIATPWYDVFPARGVNKTNEPDPSLSLSPHDQLKEGDLPHTTKHAAKELKRALHQLQDDVEERRPVSTAGEIMSQPVHTVSPGMTLDQVWQAFSQYRFRHFPVVADDGRLLGIVSDRDLLLVTSFLRTDASLLAAEQSRLQGVEHVMKRRVLTALPQTNLRELAEVMLNHRIGAVPLMNEEHRIKGIVTRSDILRTLTHQVPVSLWT